jgi:hypothetical protein
MALDLEIADYVLIVCFVGLLLTIPLIVFGRLRFAKSAADIARAWPNENVRPNPVTRLISRYLALATLQLLVDLSLVWLFGYALYLKAIGRDAGNFLEAMPPLWPWLGAIVVRVGLDIVIRSIQRQVREQI